MRSDLEVCLHMDGTSKISTRKQWSNVNQNLFAITISVDL